MTALTKADLAIQITDKLGLNNRESKELVDLFFNEIKSTLVEGKSVKLSGLGNFISRTKAERPGRNPKTGENKIISSRKVVTFRGGQKFRMRIDKLVPTVSD
jgi:integration host factor subunit alpha